MSENNTTIISNEETHANVPILNTKNIDEKLAYMELLISRYKLGQDIGLMLLTVRDKAEAKSNLKEYMSRLISFQKILLYKSEDVNEIVAHFGYSDDEIDKIKNNPKLLEFMDRLFKNNEYGYDSFYVSENTETENILFLKSFLITRAKKEDHTYYILTGYDSTHEEEYKNKYPISDYDAAWFLQLILLWDSFRERMKIHNQLNSKINEINLLIKEKEKKVEERTRSLLEALFDAKKYKIALELADVLVVLADASSHKVIYANELFETTTGYERATIISRKTIDSFDIISLSNSPEFFSEEFELAIRNSKVARGMYIVKTKNGNERQVDLSISRFAEGEGGSIYVIIGRDVTNERSIQKREKEYAENIEKLNRLIVNRELRIIELKRKVAQNI